MQADRHIVAIFFFRCYFIIQIKKQNIELEVSGGQFFAID